MDQRAISDLYKTLIDSWNEQDATTYASLIADDAARARPRSNRSR